MQGNGSRACYHWLAIVVQHSLPKQPRGPRCEKAETGDYRPPVTLRKVYKCRAQARLNNPVHLIASHMSLTRILPNSAWTLTILKLLDGKSTKVLDRNASCFADCQISMRTGTGPRTGDREPLFYTTYQCHAIQQGWPNCGSLSFPKTYIFVFYFLLYCSVETL